MDASELSWVAKTPGSRGEGTLQNISILWSFDHVVADLLNHFAGSPITFSLPLDLPSVSATPGMRCVFSSA